MIFVTVAERFHPINDTSHSLRWFCEDINISIENLSKINCK